MRLFRVITLMLVFLTTVPVTTIGVILIQSNLDTLKTLTWEAQQERVDQAGLQVSGYFANIIQDVDLLVSGLDVNSMNMRERQEMLSFILQKRPEVNILALYDADLRPLSNLLAFDANRILPSELARHQAMVADLAVADLERQRVLFSAPYTIERPARPELGIGARTETALALVIRIEASDATALGLEVSVTPLQGLVDRLWEGKRGQLLLSDPNQNLVLTSGHTGILHQEKVRAAALLARIVGRENTPRVSGALPVRLEGGQEMLAAYVPLARPDWLVVSLEPLDEAYRATRSMTLQVVWVALISLAVAAGLGVLFAFGITRPIAKCVSGALAVARGNFGFTLDIRTHNEIGELAHTFNYMSRQLSFYDGRNKELVASLERGYLETIRALANSIDAKDPYTRGHSGRVTRLALSIASELKLPEPDIRILRYGGTLHDIGKIGIAEHILGKQQALTEAEREAIRQHPVLGERIIAPIDFLQPVRPLVRHHHERIDGTGYPDGLKGDAIPLGARILNAADTFDAVTSERPYQAAVSTAEALALLHRLRGTQIDPQVCDALTMVIERMIQQGQDRAWAAEESPAAVA